METKIERLIRILVLAKASYGIGEKDSGDKYLEDALNNLETLVFEEV